MTTPDLTKDQLDTIGRFGFDRPPTADELGAGACETLDVDAIEARFEDASPLPWHQAESETYGHVVWIEGIDYDPRDPTGNTAMQTQDLLAQVGREADATFIRHARSDIPALVAEVRRLRSVVEELRAGGSVPPPYTATELPGFEGTLEALDGLTIRSESS